MSSRRRTRCSNVTGRVPTAAIEMMLTQCGLAASKFNFVIGTRGYGQAVEESEAAASIGKIAFPTSPRVKLIFRVFRKDHVRSWRYRCANQRHTSRKP